MRLRMHVDIGGVGHDRRHESIECIRWHALWVDGHDIIGGDRSCNLPLLRAVRLTTAATQEHEDPSCDTILCKMDVCNGNSGRQVRVAQAVFECLPINHPLKPSDARRENGGCLLKAGKTSTKRRNIHLGIGSSCQQQTNGGSKEFQSKHDVCLLQPVSVALNLTPTCARGILADAGPL